MQRTSKVIVDVHGPRVIMIFSVRSFQALQPGRSNECHSLFLALDDTCWQKVLVVYWLALSIHSVEIPKQPGVKRETNHARQRRRPNY